MIVIGWLILSIVVGFIAYKKEMNPWGWGFAAICFSPVLSFVVMMIIHEVDKKKKREEVEVKALERQKQVIDGRELALAINKTFNLIAILVKVRLLHCIAILYIFQSSIVLLKGFLDSIFIVPYVVIELILSIDLLLLRHLLVVFVESNV